MARLTSRQVTYGSNSGRYLGKLGRATLFRSNLSLCAEGYTRTPMCMAPTGDGETALHEPLRVTDIGTQLWFCGQGKTQRQDASALACASGRERRDVLLTAERSEEHTSELQSLMRISYAVFCLKK